MSKPVEIDSRRLEERFPGREFVALPRHLWPKSMAEVASAKSKWGGSLIFCFKPAERNDAGGVKKAGGLLAVLVEQGRNEPRPAPSYAPLAPQVKEFLRAVARTSAKEWARESLRQAGGFEP